MTQFSATFLLLSSLFSSVVTGQTINATTPVAGGGSGRTTAVVPKASDKDFTAVLHIFEARDDTAILISRGKLPDTVGSPLKLVTDLTDVVKGIPAKFILNDAGFGATGGGQLGNKTKIYSVPDGALTIDMTECANLNINLNFTHKETNPLKVFAVIDGGAFIVLPNITTKKVGDVLEGKATISDLEASGLKAVFDNVPDGTACSVSWTNGNGKKQTLKLIIGKNLRTVNTIIGICISVMLVLATITLFYVINTGK
jgi:hypothetical protein